MASLSYLYSELSRIEREIQSTEDLLNEETDENRRYRYQVTLEGLHQAKSDVEKSIEREKAAGSSTSDY